MSRIPDLYVEGRDDQWSILSLLEVNGIKLIKDEGPVNIKQTHSVSEMLDNMPAFVKAAQAGRSPVGFVLDIDLDIESRWQSICAKFKRIDFDVPDNAHGADGVILDLPAGKVGIWLMPDNEAHDGKLEELGMHMTQPNTTSCVAISNSDAKSRGWLSQLHTQFGRFLADTYQR